MFQDEEVGYKFSQQFFKPATKPVHADTFGTAAHLRVEETKPNADVPAPLPCKEVYVALR